MTTCLVKASPHNALETGDTAPVMVGREMCGGVRLVAHNLGLGALAPVAPWHQRWHHRS